ncbi:MAG: Zn-dependent hydrolase [Blastopirellula sp.]|nr:MAG: Zn-dependent hydrolase [Blastopirellula sp.]
MRKTQVNVDRLWATLMTHAEIGKLESGGICRETLTDVDKQGRDLFVQWCRDESLDVGIDEMGTIYATRPGTNSSLDPIAIGSHLDTQPTGGKFDGILGVLGGLEVIRTLNRAGIQTRRPITLINWTNEEGSRFQPSMVSSGVYAGVLTMADVAEIADADGIGFFEALEKIGYTGNEPVGARKFHSYLELHIEQGPVLEDEDTMIGVVTGAQAMSWNRFTVRGRESHAGTTPMSSRLDAMASANRLIARSFDLGNGIDDGRATVGVVRTEPASHNTIPHTVHFTLDMRHPDDVELARMIADLEVAVEEEHALGFEVSREEFGTAPAVRFDETCVDAIRDAAVEMGYSHRDIVSGAGHDAVYVSRVCPTAMVFTPCAGGISHNPIESITPEQAKAGVDVLLGATLRMADK